MKNIYRHLPHYTIAIACLVCLSPVQSAFAQMVKVKNGQFTLNNKPFYYIGTNYWYGSLLALVKDPIRGKVRLIKELDFLKSQGVTNLRILAGSEGTGLINGIQRVTPALQPEQGKFDAKILDGLDYVLYEMGKRKMHAILYLSNNWEWSGGFLQYLNWNKQLDTDTMKSKMSWDALRNNTSKFYTCPPCVDDYKKQVSYILNHVNRYTKQPYINEPAIMAWELANEPRPMRPESVPAYKIWISAMAAYIKSIDKNHLVTTGVEGLMGTDDSEELFKDIHTYSQIDYMTIHIWPKNWGWFKDTSIVKSLNDVIQKSETYITRHETIAKQLQKPMVIEEFGLPRNENSFDPAVATTSRDAYYKSVFAQLLKSRQANGAIAGCNFWAFGGTARPIPGQIFWKEGDDLMGDPPQEEQGLNAVFDSDKSTWSLIKYYTGQLK